MEYCSPERFNPKDGDHDHPLHADWRTPREAAILTLTFKNAPGCIIGVPTEHGDEVRFRTDQPQPEVFTAWLRRGKVHVYEPGMLE